MANTPGNPGWQLQINPSNAKPFEPGGGFVYIPTGAYMAKTVTAEAAPGKNDPGKTIVKFQVNHVSNEFGKDRHHFLWISLTPPTDPEKYEFWRRNWVTCLLAHGYPQDTLDKSPNVALAASSFVGKECSIYIESPPEGERDPNTGNFKFAEITFLSRASYTKRLAEMQAQKTNTGTGAATGTTGYTPQTQQPATSLGGTLGALVGPMNGSPTGQTGQAQQPQPSGVPVLNLS